MYLYARKMINPYENLRPHLAEQLEGQGWKSLLSIPSDIHSNRGLFSPELTFLQYKN
jgi:hypothetical protein